jgi:hypothetical protein
MSPRNWCDQSGVGRVSARDDVASLTPPLNHPLQQGLQRLGAEQVGEANQCLGIRDPLAIDPAEGSRDEAAADLTLAVVEAPVSEMLQQEHP